MQERRRIILRTAPFLIVGLSIFAIYLALFVNIPEMIQEMQSANLAIYLLAVFMLISEVFFFSLNWQYLLLPLQVRVSLRKTFGFVLIGAFADLLIPAEAVSGDIVKAYLMSKEGQISPGKVAASLVSQRVLGTIMITITLFLAFFGLLALNFPVSGLMLQVMIAMTILSAFALIFLVGVCIREGWTERLVTKTINLVDRITRQRFKLTRFKIRVIDALRAFYESLKVFTSKPRKLVLPVLFYTLAWFSSISIAFLVFLSIGYQEPNIPVLLLKVTAVHTLLVAVKSIPLGVPAEVGLPDIFMTTAFILLAIPQEIAAAATVLTRILTVWVRFFIGFIAVQWFGVKTLVESGVFGQEANKI